MTPGLAGEALNVGSGDPTSLRQIAEQLVESVLLTLGSPHLLEPALPRHPPDEIEERREDDVEHADGRKEDRH